MTDAEIFSHVTSGRVASDPDSFHIKETVDYLLKSYTLDSHLIKPFPRIVFGIRDNDTVNAFATKFSDVYVIGINAGTAHVMFDLFARMLSHPAILKEVGNPAEELPYLESEKLDDYPTELKHMYINGNYAFRAPKNELRQQYPMHFTQLAIRYYLEHELSHVLFGHVDYNLDAQRQVFDSIRLKNFNSQTLEMDADCTALARMIHETIYLVDNPSTLPENQRKFYTDHYSACSHIYFAVYNCMRIQGDVGYTNLLPGETTHPEPRQRQKMLAGMFEAMAERYPTKLDWKTLFDDKISRMMVESERAYELLTHKKLNPEVFSTKYYVNNTLSIDLLENWTSNIREKVLPYTFKPLAP